MATEKKAVLSDKELAKKYKPLIDTVIYKAVLKKQIIQVANIKGQSKDNMEVVEFVVLSVGEQAKERIKPGDKPIFKDYRSSSVLLEDEKDLGYAILMAKAHDIWALKC